MVETFQVPKIRTQEARKNWTSYNKYASGTRMEEIAVFYLTIEYEILAKSSKHLITNCKLCNLYQVIQNCPRLKHSTETRVLGIRRSMVIK